MIIETLLAAFACAAPAASVQELPPPILEPSALAQPSQAAAIPALSAALIRQKPDLFGQADPEALQRAVAGLAPV
ncbi:MAG: hypothetical protein KGO96_02115 [Elusimicrobia bacterium]|nr:hypothetical protein [Elusimicrobiota bacterium]MDE2236653.1 hypothetical protein [Elusimicrobiota bacterium]MDE2424691.1 hypothetical protein [Elusimicrobiota bacterium]